MAVRVAGGRLASPRRVPGVGGHAHRRVEAAPGPRDRCPRDPPEVDWLRTAVHTAKGCYRGQETIARVLNLGRPPRRLTYLQLDGSRGDLPAPGTPIEVGGRQVGVITSSARHADEGPIALALLARTVPVGTVFDIDGVAAAQEEIVPVHGKSSVSPETRPGADLSREAGQRGGSTGFGGLGSALGAR